MLQNKAFLLKNRFRSYVCGFSTQVNYYSTAHKWHRKSFTNHFARKQLLRKPPDTTILDTFAILKRFKKKCVMTTPVLFYSCFCFSPFFGKKMLPDAQAPQSLCSCPATTPNHSASFFLIFMISTLRPSSQDLQRFWHPSKTFWRNKPQSFYLAAAVWAKPPTIRRGILSRDAVQRRCGIKVYAN